ncbi:MAG: hypothetical protein GXP45_08510 [bacterium]|nr:hypothetical protein [bacterium]
MEGIGTYDDSLNALLDNLLVYNNDTKKLSPIAGFDFKKFNAVYKSLNNDENFDKDFKGDTSDSSYESLLSSGMS